MTPTAPPRPCNRPGCGALVRSPDRYCSAHRKAESQAYARQRATDPEAKRRKRFYDGKDWQRLRAYKLGQTPLCEHCQAVGRVTAASHVDHIVPWATGGAALDLANLQSLCLPCHSAKSARSGERFGRAPIDPEPVDIPPGPKGCWL